MYTDKVSGLKLSALVMLPAISSSFVNSGESKPQSAPRLFCSIQSGMEYVRNSSPAKWLKPMPS